MSKWVWSDIGDTGSFGVYGYNGVIELFPYSILFSITIGSSNEPQNNMTISMMVVIINASVSMDIMKIRPLLKDEDDKEEQSQKLEVHLAAKKLMLCVQTQLSTVDQDAVYNNT